MFDEGQLLRFEPFAFKNGREPKAKFFAVLKHMDETLVMASLPTSKNHVPDSMAVNHGCVNIPENCMSVFVFAPGQPITDGFSFPLPTYIYGEQVDEYEVSFLNQMESTMTSLGQIKPELMQELLDCLKGSSTIKRKYKRILNAE